MWAMKKVVAGMAVVVLSAALLAIWAPESPVNGVPAAEKVAGDGSGVTETPQVPAFYDIDTQNLPPAAPGTMIKTEKIEPPANDKARDYQLYRFMYHSTTIDGEDIPVSGLYAVPNGEPPETGWPLIAYAHGTMGAAPQCGLSIAPYRPKTPAGSQFTRKVEPLVEQGWAIVATDYQGMGPDTTPMYLLGDAEGRNLLDSVRAVQQWRDDIDRSKTVLWGHSQGGQAVIFASQMQQDYAPDLAIPGVVSLAPAIIPPVPAAVEALGNLPDPSGRTYFVVMSTWTWTQNYPDLNEEDIFTEEGLNSLPAVEELCADELREFYMKAPMATYVKFPLSQSLLQKINDNTAGQERLGRPMRLVQGMEDQVVINPATPAYFSLICQNGEAAQLELYPEDNHGSVVINSADKVYQWINDRFDGLAPPNNCPNRERI